ncbi:MAG: hypothetical protein QNJ98_11220 [Planctomycetota bacterium]|nr:hypothetical protein [Planctomycetota bacterium]
MLTIDEPELLHALYRVLLEGKFAEDPNDPLVAGSPLVAKVCRRVLAALDQSEQKRIDGLDGLRRELAEKNLANRLSKRALEDHPRLLKVVRRRIADAEAWPTMTTRERAEYVQALAAPFTLSEGLRDELLASRE